MPHYKTIRFKNSSIAYQVTGAGKTVVLVHGFGEDGSMWQSQVDFLKEHYRIIVPDMPGSGASDFVTGANINTYAAIIQEILEVEAIVNPLLQLEGVAMIGHSMGGYITLAFAANYPQYLNSLGLFHSSAFADDAEKKADRKKAIAFINNNGAQAFLKNIIPKLFTKSFADKHPEKINSLLYKTNNFTSEALVQYYEAMINRPDRRDTLRNFNKPVLFIIGEHDPAIPLQTSLQQVHLPSVVVVSILAQSAHMGMWEEEARANQLLLAFISGS